MWLICHGALTCKGRVSANTEWWHACVLGVHTKYPMPITHSVLHNPSSPSSEHLAGSPCPISVPNDLFICKHLFVAPTFLGARNHPMIVCVCVWGGITLKGARFQFCSNFSIYCLGWFFYIPFRSQSFRGGGDRTRLCADS